MGERGQKGKLNVWGNTEVAARGKTSGSYLKGQRIRLLSIFNFLLEFANIF
jgi:hypothetical protein